MLFMASEKRFLVLPFFFAFFPSVILTVFPVHSVVVREDKKLLTVLFPDGRDGRAFTLKVYIFPFNLADSLQQMQLYTF